ncbi:MAG TPA: substrate-binding domain-containing protein [Verrucomicrobiae bacterium]|nr:substrate-binding domain-containing protein [Verrucomicrobiae bacterium]
MAISGILPKNWTGDGILTLLADRNDVVDFVVGSRLPVVDLAMGRPEINVPRVAGDNVAIARLAGEHYLERGFKNFAWFSNNSGYVATMRRDAFFNAVHQRSKTMEDWTFRRKPGDKRGEWDARLSWLTCRLKAAPKPVAVFAFRDADAANVLEACLSGRLDVPEEVAILGVGNNEVICESLCIPLSSVKHNLEELGLAGAALLDRILAGARPPRKPWLVAPQGVQVRRSTDFLAVSDPNILAALRFMRENFHRSVCPSDTAEAVGVSRWNLEKTFRAQLGHTMRIELRRTRLAKAKDLLVNDDCSIADIAARVGFNTPQYFNNVFRSEYHVTPQKYRELRQSR